MKKLAMISQPMAGRSTWEIDETRNRAIAELERRGYGKEPLSELYADWQELVGEEAAAKAVEKSARKAERSTGAGGGGVSAGLTAAQQRELDEWNREFPHLKMTAKDFLER